MLSFIPSSNPISFSNPILLSSAYLRLDWSPGCVVPVCLFWPLIVYCFVFFFVFSFFSVSAVDWADTPLSALECTIISLCWVELSWVVLLSLLDNLMTAIGSKQASCLCLLDSSAAFDIIDLHLAMFGRLKITWISSLKNIHLWCLENVIASTSLSRVPSRVAQLLPCEKTPHLSGDTGVWSKRDILIFPDLGGPCRKGGSPRQNFQCVWHLLTWC